MTGVDRPAGSALRSASTGESPTTVLLTTPPTERHEPRLPAAVFAAGSAYQSLARISS
jgi:hypothetical protein